MTTIKKDKAISDAEYLFKQIIFKQKMTKFNIEGWEKDIVLPYLTDPQGWLGVWMLKSDEISQVLTNHRLWDVAYQADNECMEGMKPVSITDDILTKDNIDTYTRYPAFKDDEIPFSLRFAICQSAFVDSLIVNENSVAIKALYSFGYDLKKPLEHGDFLPFASADTLLAKQMNLFELEINKRKTLENELVSEQSI